MSWKVDPVKQVMFQCKQQPQILQLLFSTAPGVVEIIGVVGTSDTTAVVYWTPPSQPNGVITGYQIIYSVYGDADDNMTQAVTRNEDSFVIANLSELLFVTV